VRTCHLPALLTLFVSSAVTSADEPRPRLTIEAHSRGVDALAISPDGKALVSGTLDGVFRLWDAATGKPTATFKMTPEYGAAAAAFSPDGKTLAGGGFNKPGRVFLWDVASGKELAVLEHKEVVLCLAFSPDGKTLATGGYNPRITLWDVAAGKKPEPRGRGLSCWTVIAAVAFSPDGQHFAAADGERLHLWDMSGKSNPEASYRIALRGFEKEVYAVAFSPDSKTPASGHADQTVRLWDVATGKSLAVLRGHTDQVLKVAFGPEGKAVASAGRDGTVRLWDVAAGKERTVFRATAKEPDRRVIFHSMAYGTDGKTVAAGDESGRVRLWDVPVK